MKNMIKLIFSMFIVWSFLLLPACIPIPTETQASWHDTQYKGGPMKGVIVLLITKDFLKRRAFEDTLTQFFEAKGIKSIAGYKVIPPDVEITEEYVKLCLVGIDADAILVSQISGIIKEKEVVSGNQQFDHTDFVYPFSRYYTSSYSHIPSKVFAVENIYLDSRLYRCDSENMLWQIQLKIANVKPFTDVVRKFSKVVYKHLSKENLL